MLSTTRVFKNFQGIWQLHRTIPKHGKMTGIARFEKIATEKDAFHYQEEGIFKLEAGKSFNTYREYIYRYQNNNIFVYFVENNKTDRLFHILEFIQPVAESFPIKAKAKHLCEHDTYYATYEFYNKDEFNITYQVKGPAKDYMSNTFYTHYTSRCKILRPRLPEKILEAVIPEFDSRCYINNVCHPAT